MKRAFEAGGPGRAARAAALAGAGLLLLAACDPDARTAAERRHERMETYNAGLSDWSNLSTDMIIEKYGPPDRIENLRVVWERRGPWKKIVVWDELGFHSGDRGPNNLEQTIAYTVPPEKRPELAAFSAALYVSSDGAELSSRGASEEQNFLMINLADEIVRGQLTPEDARVNYAQTMELADSGRTSPAMEGFLFQ